MAKFPLRSGLPAITSPLPPDVRRFLDQVAAFIRTLEADGGAATYGALVRSEVLNSDLGQQFPEEVTDNEPPGKVEGLKALSGINLVHLTWEYPYADKARLAGYEIWRNTEDNFSTKVLHQMVSATYFTDETGFMPGYRNGYYYWVRAVKHTWVGEQQKVLYGAFNDSVGTFGEPEMHPEDVLATIDKLVGGSALVDFLRTPIEVMEFEATARALDEAVAAAQQKAQDAAELGRMAREFFADSFGRESFYYKTTALPESLVENDVRLDGALVAEVSQREALELFVSVNEETLAGWRGAVIDEAAVRVTDLGVEATARQQLGAQLLGDDGTALSSGIIFEERQATATAIAAEAQKLEVLNATLFGDTTSEGVITALQHTIAEAARAQALDVLNLSATILGPDGTTLSSGVIFEERKATATALGAEAVARDLLSATLLGADGTTLSEGIIYNERLTTANAIGAEATAREELKATLLGEDGTALSEGLIFDVRSASATAIQAEAWSRERLSATLLGADGTGVSEGLIARLERAIATETEARAEVVTQVTARLDNGFNGVTVEESMFAHALGIDHLEGQYTVKIDNAGHVSGFGLASTNVDGAVVSEFVINADRFFFTSPALGDSNHIINAVTATRSPTVMVADSLVDGSLVWTHPTEASEDLYSMVMTSYPVGVLSWAIDLNNGSGSQQYLVAGIRFRKDTGMNKVRLTVQYTGGDNYIEAALSAPNTWALEGSATVVSPNAEGFGSLVPDALNSNYVTLRFVLNWGSMGYTRPVSPGSFVLKVSAYGAGTFEFYGPQAVPGRALPRYQENPGTTALYGSGIYTPFAIVMETDGVGTVFIDGASIIDASIGTAAIDFAVIEEYHLIDGSITSAKIGERIYSDNFFRDPDTGAVTGWEIVKDGSFAFGNDDGSAVIEWDGSDLYVTGAAIQTSRDDTAQRIVINDAGDAQIHFFGANGLGGVSELVSVGALGVGADYSLIEMETPVDGYARALSIYADSGSTPGSNDRKNWTILGADNYIGVRAINYSHSAIYGRSHADPSGVHVAGVSGEYSGVNTNSLSASGVYGYSSSHNGVYGDSVNGYGVYGRSTYESGVYGESSGSSTGVAGVRGHGDNLYGVHGTSDALDGVYGYAYDYVGGVIRAGVKGECGHGIGVWGNAIYSGDGVRGTSFAGRGVYAESSTDFGLEAKSTDTWGVYAVSNNSSGIRATGGKYGGDFEGDDFWGAIRLHTASSASAPTHSAGKGAFYVTSDAIVYVNRDGSTAWDRVDYL